MGSLEGKHCFVTGGTSGMGKATVELFAACNAKVYTCSINQNEVDELLSTCTAKGWSVQACVCDIRDKTALDKMLEEVKVFFDGRLDVLVNNAGIVVMKRLLETNDEEYHRVMDTNLHAAYQLCKMCYPLLKASNAGSVINIGSVAGGARQSANAGPYGITKGAIHQFTRCLSCEWAAENIRANCVAPGLVHTPLIGDFVEDEEFLKSWNEEAPLNRLGQPEDIAKAVKFFATDDSSFVTGQVLYVDGGYSVRGLGY